MVVRPPPGHVEAAAHAAATGRGAMTGKAPLAPEPARIGTLLSAAPHVGAGVGVPVDGGVTDGVTVDGGVTVGALEADAPADSDAEGVADALTDAVAELVGVGGV